MAKAKKKAAKKGSTEATKAPETTRRASTSSMTGKARIETKLSAKMICGVIASLFADDAQDGDEVELFTIYGEANTTVVKDTTFGESTGLVGRFRAIRALDGKVFQAQKAYLPNVATELAVATLRELQEKVKKAEAAGQVVSAAGLEFALKVGARKDSTVNVGYRYIVEPLMQEQSDLFSRLEASLPMLPAPRD